MGTTYPYTASVGGLSATIQQLRKAFPAQVTARTLQQWGFAPKNESYILGILKHLGLIDDDGNRDPEKSKVLLIHDQEEFQLEFAGLVRDAYKDLFELRGDDAWELEQGSLISFFRTSDESSATVGQRQARTFQALAGLAGRGEAPKPTSPSNKTSSKTAPSKPKRKAEQSKQPPPAVSPPSQKLSHVPGDPRVGLTVRIELNLPATTDQKVYDGIFKSIRQHLINE